MKNIMIKYLLVAALAVVGSQAAFSQYNTVNTIPMCWTTPGGVDSTIYKTQLDASQRTSPSQIYYYNAAGSIVVVVGGTLNFGYCNGGGGGPCSVLGEYRDTLLTSASTTFAANTLYSIAVEAVSGTVTISTDGTTPVTLPIGSVRYATSPNPCSYMPTAATIAITSGSAIVRRMYRYDPNLFQSFP